MRGHRLGVGDVGEMQGSSRDNSNAKNHNVHGAEDSKLQPRMVTGCCDAKQDAKDQQRRNGVEFHNCSRSGHGAYVSDGQDSPGAHGMRGHKLGVGDVGAVSCGPWGAGQQKSSLNGRISSREH